MSPSSNLKLCSYNLDTSLYIVYYFVVEKAAHNNLDDTASDLNGFLIYVLP